MSSSADAGGDIWRARWLHAQMLLPHQMKQRRTCTPCWGTSPALTSHRGCWFGSVWYAGKWGSVPNCRRDVWASRHSTSQGYSNPIYTQYWYCLPALSLDSLIEVLLWFLTAAGEWVDDGANNISLDRKGTGTCPIWWYDICETWPASRLLCTTSAEWKCRPEPTLRTSRTTKWLHAIPVYKSMMPLHVYLPSSSRAKFGRSCTAMVRLTFPV